MSTAPETNNSTLATDASTPAPRKRRPPRRVEVSCVQVLSPAMRRITFKGAELEGFAPATPASYIKLIFPEPGQPEPERPIPDGPRPKSMRTYTPLAVRADVHEVDVDFVLHGEGPASTWAAQATVGHVLFLMGPGPGYELDTTATNHLLIVDDSALPAVENILIELPASAHVQLLVEVISAHEERPLNSAAALQTQWLARGTDHRDAGKPLEQALRSMKSIPLDAKIYLACEAAAMRRIRSLLIDELGVARSNIVGRGYWKLDTVNHPDHDYGE